MRTLAVVLGFLMVVSLLSGHRACPAEAAKGGGGLADTPPATPKDARGWAYAAVVPMPVAAAPAGVEILMCVR
jgi:hypothetical protein